MARYRPSSFGACSWTETELRATNTQKDLPKTLGQSRIYFMAFGKIFLRDTAGSPAPSSCIFFQ